MASPEKQDGAKRNSGKSEANPSTFELAVLSAILSVTATKNKPEQLVQKAFGLWCAARDINQAKLQLDAFLDGVFTMAPEEWEKAIMAYRGDEQKLKSIFSGTNGNYCYDFEREVLPGLFPSHGYSAKQRWEKIEKVLKSEPLYKDQISNLFFEDVEMKLDFETGRREAKRTPITASDLKGRTSIATIRLLVSARTAKRPRHSTSPGA